MADELKYLKSTTLPEKYEDRSGFVAHIYEIASSKGEGLSDGSETRLAVAKVPTYSTSFSVVPVAGCTDLVEIIGSSTKTVEIVSIRIAGFNSTSSRSHPISVIRRSSLNTGGTSTSPTLIPHISTNDAATAVIKVYTANPTVGTTVGNVNIDRISMSISNSTTYRTPNDLMVIPGHGTLPVRLHSENETLCVNMNALPLGPTNVPTAVYISVTLREF